MGGGSAQKFTGGMNIDHTLEEVGQQFSVTRERIRQIEAKALRKLKHPSRSRKLRSFLDNYEKTPPYAGFFVVSPRRLPILLCRRTVCASAYSCVSG